MWIALGSTYGVWGNQPWPQRTKKRPSTSPSNRTVDEEYTIGGLWPPVNFEPPQAEWHEGGDQAQQPMPPKPRREYGGTPHEQPADPQTNGSPPTAGTHGHRCTHDFITFGRSGADLCAQQTAGEPAEILHECYIAGNEYCSHGRTEKENRHEQLIRPRWPHAVGANHEKSCVIRCLACQSSHNLRVSGTNARF